MTLILSMIFSDVCHLSFSSSCPEPYLRESKLVADVCVGKRASNRYNVSGCLIWTWLVEVWKKHSFTSVLWEENWPGLAGQQWIKLRANFCTLTLFNTSQQLFTEESWAHGHTHTLHKHTHTHASQTHTSQTHTSHTHASQTNKHFTNTHTLHKHTLHKHF